MKIPVQYRIILLIFVQIILFQSIDFGMDLMNKPDSYLVNLGIGIFAGTITLMLYCLKKLGDYANTYINEQDKNNKHKN